MPKTKKSFLQKILGGNSDYREEKQVDYDTGTQADYQMQEASGNPAAGLTQAEVSSTPPSRDEMRTEGEWISDQEGQLTIDVFQTETEIVIKSTIAGVKPEDLDVQINNDMVTIRGERKLEDEIKEEDYYYQECYWGAFSRSIILPVDVQASKSEATMKNGILTIKLPKADSAQSKKIQVRGF